MEQLVGRVFSARNAAHLQHWATGSFAEHKALGDFYDSVIDKIDQIIEVYQGWDRMLGKVSIPTTNPSNIRQQIGEDLNWIIANRKKLSDGNEMIAALLDDLCSIYSQAFYMLARLK